MLIILPRGNVGSFHRAPSAFQIHYAALDALVAVHIFMVLIGRKLPDLLTRWCSESQDDDSGGDDLWQRALSVCQGIVDVGFSLKHLKNPKVRFRFNII